MPRSPDEVRKLVSSGRWKRKHLEALRWEFGDQVLFDVLFSAFTQRPPIPHSEQVAPSDILLELKPKGMQNLKSLIRASLSGWNLSIEQLPYYFRETYGLEAVRFALNSIEMEEQLDEEEHKALQTYRYWLHLPRNAEPKRGPRRR